MPSTAPGRTAPATRRIRTLVAIIALTLVAAVAGCLAGARIRSPADIAARTAPPSPTLITAEVQYRRISDAMVTRGSVDAPGTVSAVPEEPPRGVFRSIVTALPIRAGATLDPGSVVLEISGNPVFFLPGRLPTYRDLGPGMSGPDVRQLQIGLRHAGFVVADPQGKFGPGTSRAVADLYRRHQYQPPAGGRLASSAITYVAGDHPLVVTARTRIGEDVKDAVVELASGELVVEVDRSALSGALIRVGARARLSAEVLGATATGRVVSVRGSPTSGTATIAPLRPLPGSWAGQDVRVEISNSRSRGNVLAVPIVAISRGSDGRDSVLVDRPGGQRRVEVTTGVSGGGLVEVEPRAAGSLQPGQRVVIGLR